MDKERPEAEGLVRLIRTCDICEDEVPVPLWVKRHSDGQGMGSGTRDPRRGRMESGIIKWD